MEHSSHIVQVGVEATCLHFKPSRILKETTKPEGGGMWNYAKEPWHPRKDAKLDRVI